MPDIQSLRIRFAGEVEGIQIRHAGSGQHTLILRTELVCAHGQNREKSLFLPQGQTIYRDLGPGQLHGNVRLQFPKSLHAAGLQLEEYRYMKQRLPVLSQVGQQLHHILQVTLSLDGFVYIIAAAFELVAAGGILDDLALLASLHQSVVDSQGHAAAVSELGKDRLFLGGGRVFPDHPHTAVAVAENIMI